MSKKREENYRKSSNRGDFNRREKDNKNKGRDWRSWKRKGRKSTWTWKFKVLNMLSKTWNNGGTIRFLHLPSKHSCHCLPYNPKTSLNRALNQRCIVFSSKDFSKTSKPRMPFSLTITNRNQCANSLSTTSLPRKPIFISRLYTEFASLCGITIQFRKYNWWCMRISKMKKAEKSLRMFVNMRKETDRYMKSSCIQIWKWSEC